MFCGKKSLKASKAKICPQKNSSFPTKISFKFLWITTTFLQAKLLQTLSLPTNDFLSLISLQRFPTMNFPMPTKNLSYQIHITVFLSFNKISFNPL